MDEHQKELLKNLPKIDEMMLRIEKRESLAGFPREIVKEACRMVVEELRAKVPGFRRGYDEDGLAVEEFADYGPLMFFKTMFLNGYARLLDEVAERRAR